MLKYDPRVNRNNRGVAQLVARSVRDAEVGGSSPLTPTIVELLSMKNLE